MLTYGDLHVGQLLFKYGSAGVDIFFVISGFIITYATRPGTSPGQFLYRRLARIVPLYLLCTLLMAWLHGSPLIDVVRSLLFQPLANKNPPFLGYAVLQVGWTLNYEMFFYIVFALALVFRRGSTMVALVVIFSFVAAAQLAADQFTLSAYKAPIQKFTYLTLATNPITLEFCAGALLALAWRRGLLSVPPIVAVLFMATATGLMAILMYGPWFNSHGLSGFGFPATVLVGSALMAERSLRLHVPSYLMVLGASSYSLYLTHYFVLQFVRPHIPSLGDPFLDFIMILGLTLFVGIACHYMIEQPVTVSLKVLGRKLGGASAH